MTATADAQFLLPAPIRGIDAVGRETRLSAALAAAGVAVASGGDRRNAAAVVGGDAAPEAVRRGYDVVLLEGRAQRRLARGGYSVDSYLSLPDVSRPSLLLPLRHRSASAYALENWTFPGTPVRRSRNRAARALLRAGLFPPLLPTITVAAHRGRLPFLVAEARELGVPDDVEFFVRSGGRDDLSRATFFLFARSAGRPAWLLKFSRVRGYRDAFDRDDRGLGLVAATPAEIRRRAPRLLGRLEVDGFHASLETAAAGQPLADRLRTRADVAEKLALVDVVAAWILALGRSTRRDDRLADERARLAEMLAEVGDAASVPDGLLDRIRSVPTVLQHNDLGCWNIIVENRSFVAVDWESARADGLPLWDLWYFLRDALAAIDGVPATGREGHLTALCRGDLASSRVLFGWTRRGVEELGIPPDAVGALATLCWLHHSRSHDERVREAGRHAPASAPVDAFPFPRSWLADPRLGVDWSAWRE